MIDFLIELLTKHLEGTAVTINIKRQTSNIKNDEVNGIGFTLNTELGTTGTYYFGMNIKDGKEEYFLDATAFDKVLKAYEPQDLLDYLSSHLDHQRKTGKIFVGLWE